MDRRHRQSCQKGSSGLDHKWTLSIDRGTVTSRWPGKRGYYEAGVKLVSLSCAEDARMIHLVTEPATTVPTYITEGSSHRAVYPLRTLVKKTEKVIADFSDSMEYFVLDLNSTDSMNLSCLGEDGQLLSSTEGVCMLELKQVHF